MSGLTDFQAAVTRAFFSLDEARHFVLTGGAALIAHDMIGRTTGDLDLFTNVAGQLDAVTEALMQVADNEGWSVVAIRQSPTFVRLDVSRGDSERLVIDLGVDGAPILGTTPSPAGPTYQPKELAARKLLALFGRAEARDIADLAQLAKLFDLDELLHLAHQIDAGFSRDGLVDALNAIDRFADADFPAGGPPPKEIRAFAADWKHQLREELSEAARELRDGTI